MKCRNCNADLPSDAVYCNYCGATVNGKDMNSAAGNTAGKVMFQETVQPQKKEVFSKES